jgi:hypothetical protein
LRRYEEAFSREHAILVGNLFSIWTQLQARRELPLVTTQEVLEQLDLPNLKKIAKRLGIQVSKGFTGFLMQQGLGIETRRPYIDALANSGLVTLEEIDRILKTHYSRLQEERDEAPQLSERSAPRRDRAIARNEPVTSFTNFESAAQFILEYLGKVELQDICDELDVPVSGNKEDLVFRILGNSAFAPEMALAYVDKEGLKEICDALGLRTQGVRDELEERIRRVVPARPSQTERQAYQPVPPASFRQTSPVVTPPDLQQPQQPTRPLPRQESAAPQYAASEPPPLEFPETPPTTLIPEPVAPQIAQLQMVAEFLESYRPSQRFRNEQSYEIEVAQAMRHHFGPENVKTQANIPGGRIDIEVLGIGVEIKVPISRGQLQTLLGQVSIYRNYYGSNVVVLIFNDFAKFQDVNEFSNLLRGRGIQVFVK